MFKVCRDPMGDSMYTPLRQHLYRYGNGQISGRQLLAITEVVYITSYHRDMGIWHLYI